MTTTPLHIHEFSTGISADGTSDNWFSRGFTGQYMNSTLSEIPYNVERSIANDDFAIAESAIKDNPSMVGRVVIGDSGASDWSIVAVVIRGKDEYGRSLQVSRYFLAEGKDNLSKIVAWINFRAEQNRFPIFNPFESKIVGQPNISTVSIVKTRLLSDVEAQLKISSSPLLLSPDQQAIYPFPVVDSLARRKSELTGKPASWVYNVEGLEKPERFQIILPASDRALTIIQKALATKPKDQAASVIDEKALKQAIKGLADNPTVKPDHWQTFIENIFAITNAFPDPDKAGDYWRRLFDGQGASSAIKQGIYTQPMIRLLTLRAIALPETLPDFLPWLQVGAGKKDKEGSYGETSLEFQGQLSGLSQEPRLKDFLIEGVRDLVGKVLTKAVSPEGVVWLLLSEQSLWYQFQFANQLRNEFRHDLKVVGNLARGMQSKDRQIISGKFWDKIWHEIEQIWRVSPRSFNEKYAPLVDFFNQLGDSFICAHFYQLSYGQVPSKLIKRAFPNQANAGLINSHGLMIRQQGYNERGEENIVPVPLVAIIAAITLMLGFGGGLLASKLMSRADNYSDNNGDPKGSKQTKTSIPTSPTEQPESPKPQEAPSKNPRAYEAISIPSQEELDNNIKRTRESLNSITAELEKRGGYDPKDIQESIKLTLGGDPKSLQISDLNPSSKNDEGKRAWVATIYKYQVDNKFPIKDGVIDKGGDAYRKLMGETEKRLKTPLPISTPPFSDLPGVR
jgi:hypothetical protein